MSIIKGTNQIVAGFGGTKRCIGEVYFSQSNLATDNPGALPGWTGEYYENGKTLFPDLYNFVKAHSELQVTKAQYDNAIATYGECPKYVVDENTAQTSLRLPKYANYIKMANSTEGIKNIEAGLPNITGKTGRFAGREEQGTGALRTVDYGQSSGTRDEQWNSSRITFDASLSNPIYGKSDTVTPASTTLYPWVVAYAAAIPASTAQAAEFQQGLSGKADTNLGNTTPSQSFKEMSVGWGMPDYSAGITGSVAANTPVQVTVDSFVVAYGIDPYMTNSTAYVSPTSDFTSKYIVGRAYDDTNVNTEGYSITFLCPKGWYFRWDVENGMTYWIYPLKGAK